jgi:hypothetical protein
MKTTILGIAAFLFSLNNQAQNKDVIKEVKTTVTTVKDSEGEKKLIKTQEIQKVQNIELKDADTKTINKDIKETPVEVTATTAITANGVTKVVDVDRSAYYDLDGVRYHVSLSEKGYNISSDNGKKPAILRKTANNNYIYKLKNKISFASFDANGNLVLETYDDKTDTILIETFIIAKE